MNKKIYIAAAVALISLVIAIIALKSNSKADDNQTAPVEKAVPLIGVGTLEAKNIVSLAPKTVATIEALYADEGDEVRKGQLLAKMDTDELEASILESEATVQKSYAQLEAQKALIKDIEARYELSKINLDRYERLIEGKHVSQAEYDSAVAAEKSAKAQLFSAQKTLTLFAHEIKKTEASSKVISEKIDDLALKSPVDGIVVARYAEEGSTVGAGAAVLRVADPLSLWVKVYVDEAKINGIKVGSKADVSLRTEGDKVFEATVVRIGVESDRVTEERVVYLTLKDKPKKFHLGEQAEARFLP